MATNKLPWHILASIAAVCLLLTAVDMQAGDIALQVGITGSNSLKGLKDPVTVAKFPEVSVLLQAVADEPRSAGYIERSLANSKASLDLLLELGLLRAWGDRYAIGFAYLTLEDHALLMTALAPFAESLAESFRDRWPEFTALFDAYDARGVAVGELAFAAIGAISLDWDGLEITAQKGLRITADNLPDGREFLIWAKEQSNEVNNRGLYWGSHNTVANGIQFTTFGDHYSLPRLGLPDLLWGTSKRVADIDGAPRPLGIRLDNALKPYYRDDFLKDSGAILRVLREGPATSRSVSVEAGVDEGHAYAILALLQDLHYVRGGEDAYVLAIPYFSLADKPMIDAVRALCWQLMDVWLDDNSAAVKDGLGGLNAIQHGVPYEQLFTEIWHYLFGMTNKALVESGHFADPYADERLFKGMMPFAFDTEILSPRVP